MPMQQQAKKKTHRFFMVVHGFATIAAGAWLLTATALHPAVGGGLIVFGLFGAYERPRTIAVDMVEWAVGLYERIQKAQHGIFNGKD